MEWAYLDAAPAASARSEPAPFRVAEATRRGLVRRGCCRFSRAGQVTAAQKTAAGTRG